MSCLTLTRNLNPDCAALRQEGGLNLRVWIGSVKDIASITYDSTLDNLVSAMTLAETKKLIRTFGKMYKNNATISLEQGENFTARVQSAILTLYSKSAAEKMAIEDLIDAEQLFCIYETNSGNLEIMGLPRKGKSPLNYGLTASAMDGTTGTLLNDPNHKIMTLSGQLPNMELQFLDTDLATSIAALDTLSVALS
jgi:hypothetical protein